MSGLKKIEIGLQKQPSTTGNRPGQGYLAITPDEIDRYETYTIVNPTISSTWFGTCPIAGTSATGTLVLVNAIADYPRNLRYIVNGTGANMAGTWIVSGKDQFGNLISETVAIATANNGGTVEGTKIFAQVDGGTFQFGTAVGNGTTQLGPAITGTTALFGLPYKLGGTTDVKLLTYSTGPGAQTINGGTIAGFVDSVNHAVKAPVTVTGTYSVHVWAKPTYDNQSSGVMANLPQRT